MEVLGAHRFGRILEKKSKVTSETNNTDQFFSNGEGSRNKEAQRYAWPSKFPCRLLLIVQPASIPENGAEKMKKVRKVTAGAAAVPEKKRKGNNYSLCSIYCKYL